MTDLDFWGGKKQMLTLYSPTLHPPDLLEIVKGFVDFPTLVLRHT